MRLIIKTILVTLILVNNLFSQSNNRLYVGREKKIIRLSPDSLKELSKEIRQYLVANKYDIPFTNWISGSYCKGDFITKGKTDWAVLASRDNRSRIIVFDEGKTDSANIIQVGQTEDENYITGSYELNNLSELSFDRYIETATIKYIYTAYEFFDQDITLPKVDHSGIHDIFDGKGSDIRYYHNGKWLVILSGD